MKISWSLETLNRELQEESALIRFKSHVIKTLFVNLVSIPLVNLRDRIYASYLVARINWLELSPNKKVSLDGRIGTYDKALKTTIRRVRARRAAG